MKTIDASSVPEKLIAIFPKDVPQEVLTDQDSKFTSQLLLELY